jgi:hypothetical protein
LESDEQHILLAGCGFSRIAAAVPSLERGGVPEHRLCVFPSAGRIDVIDPTVSL